MYPHSLPDSLWKLLPGLDALPELSPAYLGGGSALALTLGHRKSEDLDFFVPAPFDEPGFMRNVARSGWEIVLLHQGPAHTVLLIAQIKIDLIRGRIPLKFPLLPLPSPIKNLKMADPRDIGRMKILSIGSRGSRKDFIDLYCLTRETIPLAALLALAMDESRGIRYSRLHFLKGLVDFEEADQEADPAMIWDVSWQEIRETLAEEVKTIARRILNEDAG